MTASTATKKLEKHRIKIVAYIFLQRYLTDAAITSGVKG